MRPIPPILSFPLFTDQRLHVGPRVAQVTSGFGFIETELVCRGELLEWPLRLSIMVLIVESKDGIVVAGVVGSFHFVAPHGDGSIAA